MNTIGLNQTRIVPALVALASLFLFAGLALGADTPADGEARSSATSQGQGIRRGGLTDDAIRFDEHTPLVTEGSRDKLSRGAVQQKSSAAPSVNSDFWFYGADVALFTDLDRDGYYVGIDLAFDVDTVYSVADVYAVVYLSRELGPWNEYAETDVFTIFGASAADEYVIETELVSGYPTGDYDILIELFDTYDDSFVASFGPDDSSALSFLPLEDIGRDSPPGTTIVVTDGGGGALGLLGLLALAAAAYRRATSGIGARAVRMTRRPQAARSSK